jgi:ferredoxin
MTLKIIASQCTSCSACEPECPNVAITEKNGTFVIDPKNARSASAISTRRNARRLSGR